MKENPNKADPIETSQALEKSPVSKKLEKLKTVSLKLIATRNTLPQPLFWSLFGHKIEEIRAERKKVREKKAQMFNCDWLKS